MIDRGVPVTEEELHALVDGELPADRRPDVEAWLANHPDDGARVAAWRSQGELLRLRYGGIADEPLPPRFELDKLGRSGQPLLRLATAAAVVAAFLLGGVAGWFARPAWDGTPAPKTEAAPAVRTVAADAIDAHKLYVVEVRHPIEVPADAAHLVPWLSKRIGTQLRAPDLAQIGLKLIGGRLLPGPRGAAALLMYEGPSGERFTLYAARATGPDTALRYTVSGQVAAFYWIEGEYGYVVTGPADRELLQKVASATYEQLERPAPAKNPG
jgi:anti-sigma factor RsiW